MQRVDLRAAFVIGCFALVGCASEPATPVPATAAGPALPGHTYHMVGRRESLDDIARIYQIPKQEIIAANRLSAPYSLEVGTLLDIPIVAGASVQANPSRLLTTKAKDRRVKQKPATVHASIEKPKRRSEPRIIPLD